jgi:hypothetical protein
MSTRFLNALFSGLTVVLIGAVLLLNTTEVLSWKIWGAFVVLWPLFIVLAGAQVAIGNRALGKALGALLTFITFVIIFAYGYTNHTRWNQWEDFQGNIFIKNR